MRSNRKSLIQKDTFSFNKELPEGWILTKLRDLVTINYGKGLKEADRAGGNVPVYGSNGIVGSHNKVLTNGPSIIIGRKGSIGEIHYSANSSWPIDTTYFIDKFEGVDQTFLVFALKLLNLSNLDTSTAIPGLNRDDIYDQEIPLPPLSEQQRIVTCVKALLTHVNTAHERLSRVPLIMKRFRQEVLVTAFSGRLTEEWREENIKEIASQKKTIENSNLFDIPSQWQWVLFPKLGYLKRGRSKNRPRNAPNLFGGIYPFIQTGDISQSGGRIISHKQTYSEAGLAQSKLWPKKTVCITIAANIAESAILTYPACFPDSVVGFIADDNLCLPEYIEYFMRLAKRDLSQFAPATAQKNINIEILNEVTVPLPSLVEQHEIVSRIEALFDGADAIEREVAAAVRRTDALNQAVLGKAFRGELTPNDVKANKC